MCCFNCTLSLSLSISLFLYSLFPFRSFSQHCPSFVHDPGFATTHSQLGTLYTLNQNLVLSSSFSIIYYALLCPSQSLMAHPCVFLCPSLSLPLSFLPLLLPKTVFLSTCELFLTNHFRQRRLQGLFIPLWSSNLLPSNVTTVCLSLFLSLSLYYFLFLSFPSYCKVATTIT